MFIAESVRELYDGFIRSFKGTGTKLPKLDFCFRKRSTVTSIFSGNLITGNYPRNKLLLVGKITSSVMPRCIRTIYALFNEM